MLPLPETRKAPPGRRVGASRSRARLLSAAFRYGSTRTYHRIFEAHGFDSLGMQLHELSLRGEWDKMIDAVNFEVAAEMAHAVTWDDLPKYAREHLDYAGRINLGQYARTSDRNRQGNFAYPGSAEKAAKPAPDLSEERLTWLMDELAPI